MNKTDVPTPDRACPAAAGALPPFVEPMLARPGEPFDADDHLFEIKWDGTRAVLFVDGPGAVRLMNRRRVSIGPRFPELVAAGGALPPGTVLDGEVVVLAADGRPDFSALQSREHASPGRKAAERARSSPATFMAFDQLYAGFESVMARPCVQRRDLLRATVGGLTGEAGRRILMSEGVVGPGRAYFEAACARGLEGVVAKRLSAPYEPGKRGGAWVKIKRQEDVHCVVVGYVPEGERDFGALVIAAADAATGSLACVGKVGTGFDARTRARVNRFLQGHPADAPVVPCPGIKPARWVAPGLYCVVRCMERTAAGGLRAPALVEVFER